MTNKPGKNSYHEMQHKVTLQQQSTRHPSTFTAYDKNFMWPPPVTVELSRMKGVGGSHTMQLKRGEKNLIHCSPHYFL